MSYRVSFCSVTGRALMGSVEFEDWREAVAFVRGYNVAMGFAPGFPDSVKRDRRTDHQASAPVTVESEPVVILPPFEPESEDDHQDSAPTPSMPVNDMLDAEGNYIHRSSEETRAKQSAAAKANAARNNQTGVFKCDVCGKEFDSERGLNGHRRMHGPSNGKVSPVAQMAEAASRIVVEDSPRQRLKEEFRRMVSDDALGVKSFGAVGIVNEAWIKNRAHGHCWPTEADIETLRKVIAKAHEPVKAPQVSNPTPQVMNGTPQVAVQDKPVESEDVKCVWLIAFKAVCEFAERGDWAKAAFAVCQDSPWSSLTPGQVRAICERFREHALNLREAFRTSPAEYQALKLKVRSVIEVSATNGHIQFYGDRSKEA